MRPLSQFLDDLAQDLKYAFRGLRKSPGFAVAVIVTLAFGIGANSAMFGIVDRLMFRPYPYLADADHTHRLYFQQTFRGERRTSSGGLQYTRYTDIKEWTSSFSNFAAFTTPNLAVGVGESARERRVAAVSAGYWAFFTARPVLGRFFTQAEDVTPRGADVAVLSYGYWQSEFGGRSDVIGKVIQVANFSATVIGVAPAGFVGTISQGDPITLYVPITTYRGWADQGSTDPTNWYTKYNNGWVNIMVRRKPSVSIEQANADFTQAYRKSYQKELGFSPNGSPIDLVKPAGVVSAMKPAAGPDPSLEARTALWVTGVAAIVLLIACANVANLFLARALKRQREIAVRLALGVTRGRLVRQTLTESVVLSLIGCAVGLLVAYWGGAGIRQLLVQQQDAPLEAFTDWRTLGVAIGAAMICAVLTGLAPAFVSRSRDVSKTLKAGSREGSYQRSPVRSGLLVLQGALSVVLLVGAGLFVRSLDNVRSMRIGYDAEPVLYVQRSLRGAPLDSAARVALRNQLVEKARSIPGVASAAWINTVPFWSNSSTSLFVAGIDTVSRLGQFTYQVTTKEYFDVMGTRILRGRSFTDGDRHGAERVMIVSEGMARTLWPNVEALGKCVRVGRDTMPCTTVVGVAEEMVQNNMSAKNAYTYYMPLEQFRPAEGNGLFLRMTGDPKSQQEAVRNALQAIMPGQTYVTVMSLFDIVDGARRSWQLGATMFVAFGFLALLVAAIGLYGVIGYNVTQRMHELGVRVALGAQARDILRLVVGQGMAFAVAGVVLGGVAALVASRWIQPLLFRQSAKDPIVYAIVAAIMLLVALAASAAPAARAAKADPNSALRAE